MIAGVLPDVAEEFGVTTSQAGYAITWYAATVAVLGPVVAMTMARVPREVLMAGGLGLVALGTAAAALAPGLGGFVAGRAVAAVGGAALVPTVFAAVPRMVPPARRGQALSTVELGFGVAVAVGAPLGTVLAHVASWRLAMLTLAALAGLVTAAMVVVVRGLPAARRLTAAESLSVLTDRRLLLLMLTQLLLMLAFNTVYAFTSEITLGITDGDGGRLAGVLALCGGGGLVGTAVAGRLCDSFGSGRTGVASLGVLVATTVALVWCHDNPLVWPAFLLVGVSSQMAVVPQLHRLFEVRPGVASVSSAWNSTAMYVGIAGAPVLGAALLPYGPAALVLGAALAAAAALVVFGAALLDRGRVRTAAGRHARRPAPSGR